MFTGVIVSIVSMAGIGLLLSLILAVADKKLAVKEDPRVEKILEALPGANCGACGYAGCAAYAAAIVNDNAAIDLCKPGGNNVLEKISEIMGVEAESVEPKVARVFCSGGDKEAVKDKIYSGVKTCASANMVGGEKACSYSCLGYGDCVEACPFDAMYMGNNGLPVVVLEKCTGCGECVKACPRGIMRLTSYDEVVHVFCSSKDKGGVVRKVCSAGCIACKLCEKDDPTGSVKVVNNLAVIDYSINKAPVDSIKRCPTKVIRIAEPVPGYENLFDQMIEKNKKMVEQIEKSKAKEAEKEDKKKNGSKES